MTSGERSEPRAARPDPDGYTLPVSRSAGWPPVLTAFSRAARFHATNPSKQAMATLSISERAGDGTKRCGIV